MSTEVEDVWDVIVIGAGIAGLSAGVYLGRALRRVLIIDGGNSQALWEPEVQNYLGFPWGVAGVDLLERGRAQVGNYGVRILTNKVETAYKGPDGFRVRTKDAGDFHARRLLLCTGLYHLPPEIPGVDDCLGHSMFFCKDCDAYRVQGQSIVIVGENNDAVEYALAMLLYSARVLIATNGRKPKWDSKRAAWLEEYHVPVVITRICGIEHQNGKVSALSFDDGKHYAVQSIFATRGDLYHNRLASELGAELDAEGQVLVDERMHTSVPGLYAAGCVTPANCQMIIAAGQGATAAQSINRDLFEESLGNHTLRRCSEQPQDWGEEMENFKHESTSVL